MKLDDTDLLARRFAEFLSGEAPPLRPADLSVLTFRHADTGFASCLIFAAGWYSGQDGADVLLPPLLDGALREGAVPDRWLYLIDAIRADLELERAGFAATDRINRFLDEYDSTLLLDAIATLRRVRVDGAGRPPHHDGHLTALLFALWLHWQDGAPHAALEEAVRIGAQEAGRMTEEGADLCSAAIRALSLHNALPAVDAAAAAVAEDSAEESGVSGQVYRETRLEVALALRDARVAAWGRTGDPEHLDEVIRLGATALEFAAGDGRADLLSAHAAAFTERFVRSGSNADRDAAINARWRERVELPREDENWLDATEGLRALIAERYRADEAPADLSSLVDLGAELLEDPRTDPERRVGLLHSHLEVLWERYKREARVGDLALAVAAGRELAELVGDADPAILSTVCFLLCRQYPLSRDLDDLRLAIDLGRRATAHPAELPGEQARRLANLFSVLIRYAEDTGSIADFDAAIEAARAAADLYPDEDPERTPHLVAVASAWCGRFQLSGAEADLAAAIRFGRAAMASAVDRDQEVDSAPVLVAAFALRLERFGDLAALDEALELVKRGWRSDPGWLQSLGALVSAVRGRAADLAIDPQILDGLIPAFERASSGTESPV